MRVEKDVIVVGAGISGLGAARVLAEAGKRVALIEARDRGGGRIHTLAAVDGGLPIELGAEFIHGLPEELIHLVDEAGLSRFELEGESLCFDKQTGVLAHCESQREVDQLFDDLATQPRVEPDLNFNELVAKRAMAPEAAAWARNYVEGFNAAEGDRISIQSLATQQVAENQISGDRLFRVVEGYAEVPAFLLRRFLRAGGEVFLSTTVHQVDWKPGRAEVRTGGNEVFCAPAVVVTLPLGVLQAKSVTFTPEPREIFAAAGRLAMGTAARVVYEFPSKFGGLEGASFVMAPEVVPPTWWTTNPNPSGMVTGWVAGRKAASLDRTALPDSGLSTLATILGSSLPALRSQLIRWSFHDWQSDPYSLGAYTYVLRGGINASRELSAPVAATLFFAGEHTDVSGHWGTVHGALRSGYRAAGQVLTGA